MGNVWNEAADSDAIRAVGDALDVARVKISTGLPLGRNTDKVSFRLHTAESSTPPDGLCNAYLIAAGRFRRYTGREYRGTGSGWMRKCKLLYSS